MNINIQVDSSLFNTGPPGSGSLNPNSGSASVHVLGTNINNSASPQQRLDTVNSVSFSSAVMQRQGTGILQSSQQQQQQQQQQQPQQTAVVPSVGAVMAPPVPSQQPSSQQLLSINNGPPLPGMSSLPPLTTQRSFNNCPNGQLTNNELAPPSSGNVEQFSVNVTITKVGNQLISSRVDISKQLLPEDIEDQLNPGADESSRNRRSFVAGPDGLVGGGGGGGVINYSSSFQQMSSTHAKFIQQQLQKADSQEKLLKQKEKERVRQLEIEEEEKNFERYRKFDKRSLFIFSNRWRFRQIIIRLLRWKYYDYFMILSIAGNSICLAMTDYTDDTNSTQWNQVLDKVDQGFTVVYATEALLKIIAFGFIIHKRSYLRDTWNVLDFIVVIIGIISLIPSVPNLKSLRTMRVLRPLRSINAVPSMKRLVATLLMSLPQMGYLVSLVLFFIGVFAILGMQMFARDLYYRCRLTDMPTNNFTEWLIDETQQRCCGGLYECSADTYCHALIQYRIPLEVDQVETWEFIQNGIFTFDNIGVSILSIFRVITLEGWTNVMYNYMDSSGFIAGLYFPSLVVIGSFFLLNLFLAVIMETFSEMNEKQKEKEQRKSTLKDFKRKISNAGTLLGDREIENMIKVAKKKLEIQNNGMFTNVGDAALILRLMSRDINSPLQGENSIPHEPQTFSGQQSIEPAPAPQENQWEKNQMPDHENEENFDNQVNQMRDDNEMNSGRNLNNQPSKEQIAQAESPFDDKEQIDCCSFSCISSYLLLICESQPFTVIINFTIIANTLVLGLDQYPVDIDLQNRLDITNIVFFTLFFGEMVIKIFGMGPRLYISDQYNIFDSLIVTLSIIDMSLSYTMPGDSINSGRGAISAFRAFRLLRIFKLAKSWTSLKLLLQTIVKSLKDISSFSVLLFLLMFIYILLGMEIFAVKQNDTNTSLSSDGRANFNNFFNGFIVVFTVLTGENWDQTMFQFAKQKGYLAIFFFISLVIIGVMIFLNLFLAILLENFEVEDDDDEESPFAGVIQKLSDICKRLFSMCGIKVSSLFHQNKNFVITEELVDGDCFASGGPNLNHSLKLDGLQAVKIAAQETPFDATQNLAEQISVRELNSNEGDFQIMSPGLGSKQQNLGAIQEIDEDRSPSRFSSDIDDNNFTQRKGNCGFSAVDSTIMIHNNPTNFVDQQISSIGKDSMQFRKFNTFRNQEFEFDGSPDFHRQSSIDRRSLADTKSRFFKDSLTNVNPGHTKKADTIEQSVSFSPSKSCKQSKTMNFAVIMYQKTLKPSNSTDTAMLINNVCEGDSLFFFDKESCLRIQVTKFIKSRFFEGFIMLLILISSILLALDNPLNDPDSYLMEFLKDADIILTIFFFIESILKIISYGMLFNGKHSYLRNGWNIIDFAVVIVSIISLSISGNKLKIVKILRLLRVLRPLRVISRNKGLKIGIQALFMAIPAILNVIVVSTVFFLIFGIIGVNYFKGAFFSCQIGSNFPADISDHLEELVIDKYDCLNLGGAWINYDQNFDNVPEAMSTLFQISTTEGWIDVMNRGVDSIAIDYEPKRNHEIMWALFFMAFIILGNFLILNLFVGVVISTFNKEKEILGKNNLLSQKQREWLELKKQCMNISPKVIVDVKRGRVRQFFANIVLSKRFEIFILVCIIMNTLTLTVNWYSEPVSIDDLFDYINYSFALVFAFESTMKMIAFGPISYFKDSGNIFDFVIVITSIASSIFSIVLKIDFGASTTFIRALRITRIFKFIKKSKQINVIFETLIVTLPALTNVGGLLLLFLYMYSVLGVFLFSEVQLQENLNTHANFQSFGVAFLTLLRCSTGEAWDSIMMDTVRSKTIIFQCNENDFDYQRYVENGYKTDGCGSQAGTIFFLTYFLMVPLIFLNLFIAIILEGFEETNQKANSIIQEDDLERFRECWCKFDKNGTGFMKIIDFPEFMMMLGEPLGWRREVYEGNINLQDDYLEDLFMNIYNDFSEYQFWDVLLALTKVYMVNDIIHQQQKVVSGSSMMGFNYEDGNSEYSIEDIPVDGRTISPRLKRTSMRVRQVDPEEKLKVRLELEFEAIDGLRQDVMDVEEIKMKEASLRKGFSQMESNFNSAHIKAARKILAGLKRLREAKNAKLSARSNRLNDESEINTVTASPLLKPVSYKKQKSKRSQKKQRPKISNKFEQRKTSFTPQRRDSHSHKDLSAIDSSNMLIDESSLNEEGAGPSVRFRDESKPQYHGAVGISGIIKEYEEFEAEHGLEDDEVEELKLHNNWHDQPSNQQQQVPKVAAPFRNNNVPQIILRPVSEIESVAPIVGSRPPSTQQPNGAERRPVMMNPFIIRHESSRMQLEKDNQ